MSASIVIPTYNGRAYLAETLPSAWAQGAVLSDVVVADDASNDGTAEVAEELAGEAPVPMRVVRLVGKNIGRGHWFAMSAVFPGFSIVLSICSSSRDILATQYSRHPIFVPMTAPSVGRKSVVGSRCSMVGSR